MSQTMNKFYGTGKNIGKASYLPKLKAINLSIYLSIYIYSSTAGCLYYC